MITQVKFQNFKALKNAGLKLGPFNVVVGPNGSGKSSVLQGLEALVEPNRIDYQKAVTAGMAPEKIRVSAALKNSTGGEEIVLEVGPHGPPIYIRSGSDLALARTHPIPASAVKTPLANIKIFSLEASSLGSPVDYRYVAPLSRDGKNLAGALTHLRDKDEHAYNQLREEFTRWIPEYDSIGFDSDQNGGRNLTLRQKMSRQVIPASQASEGTLLALALLTVIHQPTAPILVGLEEPDRGLHPRLLRDVRDALYRLSFPSDFGIKRPPIPVLVTTHSPFFLDLFRDHPEQVIIAEKQKDGTATFKNLSDDPGLRELIGDAPLGEVWFSGVLGGVPVPA